MDTENFIVTYDENSKEASSTVEEIFNQIEYMTKAKRNFPIHISKRMNMAYVATLLDEMCRGDLGMLSFSITEDPLEFHIMIKRRHFFPTAVSKQLMTNIIELSDQVDMLIDKSPRDYGLDTDSPMISLHLVFNLDMDDSLKRHYYR